MGAARDLTSGSILEIELHKGLAVQKGDGGMFLHRHVNSNITVAVSIAQSLDGRPTSSPRRAVDLSMPFRGYFCLSSPYVCLLPAHQ